jgi:hypothetical protein
MASLPSSPLCYFMKGKEDAYLKLFQTQFRKRKKKEYIRHKLTQTLFLFPLLVFLRLVVLVSSAFFV